MPRLTRVPGLSRSAPWEETDLLVRGKRPRRRRRVHSGREQPQQHVRNPNPVVDNQPNLPIFRHPVDATPGSCPICEHPEPPYGVEFHLANYHTPSDMLWMYKARTGSVTIPQNILRLTKRNLANTLARLVQTGVATS